MIKSTNRQNQANPSGVNFTKDVRLPNPITSNGKVIVVRVSDKNLPWDELKILKTGMVGCVQIEINHRLPKLPVTNFRE